MFHGEPPLSPGPPQATKDLLFAGLQELGLEAGPSPVSGLAALAELVASWAEHVNLSAHRQANAVARSLVLDAVALARELPVPGPLVDLGSGAGFPGFPIAILQPERPVTLVESRERAHHFQRAVVRALKLPNVELLLGRAEQLPPQPARVALAQAMGPPQEVLALLGPWAAPDGWLALPCAVPGPSLAPPIGFHEEPARPYQVPLGGPERSLWLARRDP